MFSDGAVDLYVKEDEGYFYLMGHLKTSFSFDKDKLAVGIDLTGHGNNKARAYQLSFSEPADFLLVLDGKNQTRLLTDAYYDLFYYQYAVQDSVFPQSLGIPKQNSGIFDPIKLFLSYQMVLPIDGRKIPPQSYEAGLLRFGNANPGSPSHDSLSDFYFKNNSFEIRIPWYLLNVVNPAEKMQIADFYQNGGISFDSYDQIGIGAAKISGTAVKQVKMTDFSFDGWSNSTYHERFKNSYPIITKGFQQVMHQYQ